MTIDDITIIDSHNNRLCLKRKGTKLFEVRQHFARSLLDTAERMTARNEPLDVGRQNLFYRIQIVGGIGPEKIVDQLQVGMR